MTLIQIGLGVLHFGSLGLIIGFAFLISLALELDTERLRDIFISLQTNKKLEMNF